VSFGGGEPGPGGDLPGLHLPAVVRFRHTFFPGIITFLKITDVTHFATWFDKLTMQKTQRTRRFNQFMVFLLLSADLGSMNI